MTTKILFKVFFIAICIDFVTGVLVAAKQGKLRSRTCSDGIFRSIGECVVLCIFMTLDYYIPLINPYITTFLVGFMIKEGLSIIENLVKLDVWIPEKLKKTLEVGIEKIEE